MLRLAVWLNLFIVAEPDALSFFDVAAFLDDAVTLTAGLLVLEVLVDIMSMGLGYLNT